MQSLKGKVALVTGASKGIGKAIAIMLAKHGVNLALNSSSLDNLKLMQREIELRYKDIELMHEDIGPASVEVLLCPADLSDYEAPAEIIKNIINKFGCLDILINNAGIAISKSIEESTVNDWDLQMAVNARAPFLLCREAIPYLRKSESPAIINISSVVGKKGYVNQAAYTASKHALMGMTKVLAQEVFDDNIRVHIISPGGVATDMVSRMRPDLDVSVMPKPEDIADIVEFLLKHRGNAVIDDISVRRAGNCPWK